MVERFKSPSQRMGPRVERHAHSGPLFFTPTALTRPSAQLRHHRRSARDVGLRLHVHGLMVTEYPARPAR